MLLHQTLNSLFIARLKHTVIKLLNPDDMQTTETSRGVRCCACSQSWGKHSGLICDHSLVLRNKAHSSCVSALACALHAQAGGRRLASREGQEKYTVFQLRDKWGEDLEMIGLDVFDFSQQSQATGRDHSSVCQ